MKTIKAIVLLFCILLSGCRPVYIIVTQEAPKVNVADSIQIKINQPWSRASINYEKTHENGKRN